MYLYTFYIRIKGTMIHFWNTLVAHSLGTAGHNNIQFQKKRTKK